MPYKSVLADSHQCDRRLPACTSCSGLGAECIPRNQDFNTVSELSHTSVIGRALDTVNINRHGTEDSSVRATMGAIGFLSRNAMAEPRDNSDDLPRKFSLAEVISGALAIDGRDPSTAMPAPQTPDMNSRLSSESRDLTLEHVRKFLEWPIIMPYIDKDIYLRQCEDVMAFCPSMLSLVMDRPLSIQDDYISVQFINRFYDLFIKGNRLVEPFPRYYSTSISTTHSIYLHVEDYRWLHE
ncbi:uncharacterized protein CLUP02_02921 [Colletotrichum lupini]|uniref:Zn(2)-C6 fungal-type domain-containing protein n=1 Tax=Colletotrichum lupini TaxID=145971 RepID=A0A9Q8WBB3_9PEZI|nr:uncharacterized protein CLUP02_02921 [Colletotrichum lupini]UQC77453.1 hypothetical protein CLUP02_02921 [Colletotrichum lupini]